MEYKKVLQAHQLKLTPKRLAILELLKEEERYLSPREIWEQLKRQSFTIGLPTVYRILQECYSIQLLEVFISPETQINYFYVKQDLQEKPHHFLCTKCRKVNSFENPVFSEIRENLRSNLHVEMQHHYQITTGMCENCQ